MRPQHEVNHQGYTTIKTVQHLTTKGYSSVSWEGEKPKPHLKPWESEWHQNLNNPTGEWGKGIISHLQFFT